MSEYDKMIQTLQFEIQKIEENPKYQDGLKIEAVMQEYNAMREILARKYKVLQGLIQKAKGQSRQVEEEEYAEEEEPEQAQRIVPMAKKVMPKPRREDYEEPNEARIREIEAKISKAQPLPRNREEVREELSSARAYTVEPEELGLDEVPGLPEDLEDLGEEPKQQVKRK